MATVKLKSKNIKDPKKLKYYLPFSFMVTTTICPELIQKLYGSTAKNNDTPASKKPSYVSSNYEKYCNTFQYSTESTDTIETFEKKSTEPKKGKINRISTRNYVHYCILIFLLYFLDLICLSRNARALKRICPPVTVNVDRLNFEDILKFKVCISSLLFN